MVVLALPVFSFAFQQMSMMPALPEIARDLDASTTWSTWTITSFMLFAAVTTPIMGRLADQIGRRRILLVALGLFVAGSIGSALAPDLATLVAFRSLQGAAAAFVALTLTLLPDVLPRERLAWATGVVAATLGLANVVAVTLSPLLTDLSSWRWSFVISAVLCGAGLLLIPRVVPDVPARAPGRIDVAGATSIAIAIAALMVALTEGGDWGWLSGRTLGLAALSTAAASVWVLVELRSRAPMVDLRTLRRRTIALSNGATAFAGFACFGLLTLVPRLAAEPNGFDASTTAIGLYLLPGTIAGLAGGLLLGRLAARRGWRAPLVLALFVFVGGATALAALHAAPWHVVLAMTFVGYGNSTVATTTIKLVADDVRPHERGVATALNSVAFQGGGVVGAQVIAAVLAGSAAGDLDGYTAAFETVAAVCCVGLALALLLRPPSGRGAPRTASSTAGGEPMPDAA
jgi:predicted MFS family arabinose efflux permease